MTVYATPIGAFSPSANAGVVYLDNTSKFNAVAPSSPGQLLCSTGDNTYTFLPQVPSSNSSGLVGFAMVTRGGTIYNQFAAPSGNNTSSYNASGLLFSTTYANKYPNSLLLIQYAGTQTIQTGTGYSNLYINPATSPAPVASASIVMTPADSSSFLCAGTLSTTSPAYVSNRTYSVCCFGNLTGASLYVGAPSDYLTVSEFMPTVPNNAITGTVNTSVATPVTLFIITVAASSSVFITGSVLFSDPVAEQNGNGVSFSAMAQRGASGNVTVAFNTFLGQSIVAIPAIVFTPGATTLTCSVNGLNGVSMNCLFSYTAAVGV